MKGKVGATRSRPGAGNGPGVDRHQEARILSAWQDSAAPWAEAVRLGAIESRRQVTDAAIVAAVMERGPRTVLDVGCGEGWLARALTERGARVLGVDAVEALIEAARAASQGRYEVMRYEDLAAGALDERFDVVVCNFALLGRESVDALFSALPGLLAADGAFIVQTLHPVVACGEEAYRDGWREGSWAGFGPAFGAAAPWYFRTLAGWFALFRRHGLELVDVREPLWPTRPLPASILFTARPAAAA